MRARGTSSRLIAAGSTLGSLAALWLLDEQLGVGQCAQWLVDDYRGMLRTVHHQVVSPTLSLTEPINVTLNALTRPPPIGCLEWPAGRVLLQWCLDCLPLRNATILEIGSGIGTTAIGLALANDGQRTARRVVATDAYDEVLDLLRANATLNGIDAIAGEASHLTVVKWDAAGGAESLASLPVVASELTHIIGADLIYWGGADDAMRHHANDGLVSTLAQLCRAAPHVEVVLLCVARGPAKVPYNADTQVGDLPHRSAGFLSLDYFEAKCASHGLIARRELLPEQTADRVHRAQIFPLRAAWWLIGIWDSLVLYRVSLRPMDGSEPTSH